MNLRLTATLLVAGALSTAAPAFADSITLNSGTATVTYNNTGANAPQNTGLATTGTAVVVTPPNSTPISGTQYISYDPKTWTPPGSPSGTTVYTTTFTGNYAYLGGGSLILAADDNVVAYLNGVQIGTTIPSSYNTIMGPFYYSGVLVNGLNTLTFNVFNGSGATDLDFKFTAASSVTPEPNSLMLLGTGLVGVVGAMRKRLFA